MQYEYIETDSHLANFCQEISGSDYISFDTEFVSEDTYFPELCLIQVASENQLAVIDTKEIKDQSIFWETLALPGHRTIVHAGREEFRFCQRACAKRPYDLFDIQLAAAFVGLDYPSSYGKLIQKTLDVKLQKGETRTDWRKRPLTNRQIEYALQDVTYLKPLHDHLVALMTKLDRISWFQEDMEAWQTQVEEHDRKERWRRVSGITAVPDRALVIVREIWRWREAEAQQKNRPPRRILRDDLIIELARRGKSDARQIRAIRGLERSLSKHAFSQIANVIEKALQTPKSDWPKSLPNTSSAQANLLGQFINTALTSICRAQKLAPSMVGTIQSVRDLITYHLYPEQFQDQDLPGLAVGWRKRVVGKSIEDLLAGNTVIRIHDPLSTEPIILEPFVAES